MCVVQRKSIPEFSFIPEKPLFFSNKIGFQKKNKSVKNLWMIKNNLIFQSIRMQELP